MAWKFLKQMDARVALDRDDSDTAYFDALIRYANLVCELSTLVLVSGLLTDKDRLRYKFLFDVIRVDSPGGWHEIIGAILTGPAGQFIHPAMQASSRDLSERVSSGWRADAVHALNRVLAVAAQQTSAPVESKKVSGRDWVGLVAELRNKQLSHGFPSPAVRKRALSDLEQSVRLMADNLQMFNNIECAFLSQNLSGKYRVVPISDDAQNFTYLKSERTHAYEDGVYIWLDEPVRLHLVETDVDLLDFFVPNGNYRNKSFEVLSYVTGKSHRDSSELFEVAPVRLLSSETQGRSEMILLENVFTNLPPPPEQYINRSALEGELRARMLDDYTRIITLSGRGGIGKTSLALRVLHDIVSDKRFDVIAWFSARDIDLVASGPKQVRPQAISEDDIATQYFGILGDAVGKGDAIPSFERIMASSPLGPTCFVFDNFETVNSPGQLYAWLDAHIRLPNKVLITTRLRQSFKGDYKLDVTGMDEKEANLLIDAIAKHLSIESWIDRSYRTELIHESDGHPYVLKILLGAAKNAGRPVKVERLISGVGDILTALFERTYVNLSLPAQRIFLTLCSWRSIVPRIALEAVLLRAANERVDVDSAIEELVNSSLIEIPLADREAEEQIYVPLTAAIFGQRKLVVSPLQTAVEADSQLLQLLGATGTKPDGKSAPRFDRLLNNIEGRLAAGGTHDFPRYAEILEYIATYYPMVRLRLARVSERYAPEEPIRYAQAQYLKTVESAVGEDRVEGWRAYVEFARRNHLRFDEIHGLVQLSLLAECDFQDISECANRINAVFRDEKDLIDQEERKIITRRLADVMRSRIERDGTAIDYSRLAWLYMNINDEGAAEECVLEGLNLESANEHLCALARRLGL